MSHPTEYDLLAAARSGDLTYDWAYVEVVEGGRRLVVSMTADALRVRGVRGTVTAQEAQLVADAIGAVLPTAKLLDLRNQRAGCHTEPHPQPISSSDAAVVRHSRAINADAAKRGHGIVANVGKHWVLDEAMTSDRAVLYGWHVPRAPRWHGIRVYPAVAAGDASVVQPVSTAHNYYHHDYSMTLVLCHASAMLDGTRVSLADALASPELCRLALHTERPIAARCPIA